MDVFEALYTTRAMRRMSTEPVPQPVVEAMLDAAIRSPSGGNTQNWRFVTVTATETIGRLGELYAEAWAELNATVYAGRREAAEAGGDDTTVRVLNSAQWLADNFGTSPLVVLAYHRNDPSGASIYPAVWSLMLAARAHGVDTTLTTVLGMYRHLEVADLLGVPLEKGWENAAAIPCGYPLGRWGVAVRSPVHEVVYEEGWGSDPSWRVDEPMWSG